MRLTSIKEQGYHADCKWQWSFEVMEQAHKLTPGTVAEQSQQVAMRHGEPLLIAMDALYQYASIRAASNMGKLSEDYVMGPYWMQAAKGIRNLLNGDGAIAISRKSSQDSKDNGVIEALFWAAVDRAGYTEKDLDL
jgi:hypothetical protein